MSDSITVVKALLRAELVSARFAETLDVINAELSGAFGYSVVIRSPAVVYPYERQELPEAFPSAELLGLNSDPELNSSADDYEHAIDVMWMANGDSEESVVREVEGLVLATRRHFKDFRLSMPGDTGCPVIPGTENYGPLMSRGRDMQQPLVKAGVIRLRVHTLR